MKKDDSQQNLTSRFVTIVRQGFRVLHRKHKIALGVIFLAILFAGLVLAGVLESFLYMPATAKFILAALLLMSAIGAILYYSRKLTSPTFKDFYQQFGKKTGDSKLSDALDLHFSDNQKSRLHNAAIHQNLQKLNPKDIQSRLERFSKEHKIHKYYTAGLSGALGSLLLLVGFFLIAPSAMDRFTHLWINYEKPNPYNYTIKPGTLTLEQGESFTPKINFKGDAPKRLSLSFKTDIEEIFRQRNPVDLENNQASFAPISLTTNGNYYIEMDGFKSREFRVTVQLRPRLEELSLQVVPPGYTRLDTTNYSYPFSKIQAYKGSQINLVGKTNKPVARLSMRRSTASDSAIIASQNADSTRFNHQWILSAKDTVSFRMSDSAGLSNKNKFRFILEPREDQHPFVNLVSPSQNMKMKQPENLELQYEAGDDFGLTSAFLRFELQRAFTKNPDKGSVPLPVPRMNKAQNFTWDVPKLDPKPRDVLTYWIEVRDNDAYNGAKVGQSQKLTITFPSMTEYMDELESNESEVSESLENISKSFDKMQRDYDEFKNQLKRNPETNWDQKKQLGEVEKERQEIDKKVDELNKKFEEIRKEIDKNQAMSPETLKAYDELQKLMKEINDPELQKALEELRNSLGKMNPEQMRKALENYEFNEELYKERINRTMELFKSLKLNSDLEKMARSLDELAKQEQQISKSEQSPSEDLEQQKAIEKDLNKLKQQLDSLKTPEKARDQVQELRDGAGKELKNIQQDLQKNMEQLKNQQQNQQTDPGTKQQQHQIQKQMQQTAQQMREAKQQLNKRRKQINMSALEYVLYSLIDLSVNQEDLTKETENLPPRSQAFVEKARKERNISSQFSTLSDSLFKLSSQIPSFSNRINKKKTEVEGHLELAVNTLEERDASKSTVAQRESLGGINEIASMIASLIDQLQNQQGGASGGSMSMQQFMEELKNMSGQQQKLNQQIQNLINDIQGNRLSRDQMDRLNQMSRQQNRIRKQLQKLQRNGQLESGDRVLSELERMSEQMEDAINDLRGGQLDRQMMKRQQNILSRMLSAEKAVQERGKEDRREATTAEENPNTTPPDITLEELQQKIRKMLNDPNRTKFTDDYQRLIEQYFELLKKLDKKVEQ